MYWPSVAKVEPGTVCDQVPDKRPIGLPVNTAVFAEFLITTVTVDALFSFVPDISMFPAFSVVFIMLSPATAFIVGAVGAVVSTVILRGCALDVFLTLSCAVTFIVYWPSVAKVEPGTVCDQVAESAPIKFPVNTAVFAEFLITTATVVLVFSFVPVIVSVLAFSVAFIMLSPNTLAFIVGAVGAVVSTVILRGCALDVFPAGSCAVTLIVYRPSVAKLVPATVCDQVPDKRPIGLPVNTAVFAEFLITTVTVDALFSFVPVIVNAPAFSVAFITLSPNKLAVIVGTVGGCLIYIECIYIICSWIACCICCYDTTIVCKSYTKCIKCYVCVCVCCYCCSC